MAFFASSGDLSNVAASANTDAWSFVASRYPPASVPVRLRGLIQSGERPDDTASPCVWR